jgi:hypothetical protein
MDTRKNLGLFLKETGRNRRIAEVGVLVGKFSKWLLLADPELLVLIDAWAEGKYGDQDVPYTVDGLGGRHARTFFRYLEDDRVRVFREDSVKAAMAFPNDYFDCVYIDANHTVDGCYGDMVAYWPKVRAGGLLCGHDYKMGYRSRLGVPFGVVEAVEKFTQEYGLAGRVQLSGESMPSWFIEKGVWHG